MKVHEALWSSISILIGAVLAIFAFAGRVWQPRLLLAAFSIWCMWVLSLLVFPRLRRARRLRERRARTGQRAERRGNTRGAGSLGPQAEEVLVRHVNYRISDYLHSVFPNAVWEWETQHPERLILRGGVGRIQIHGVPDYNYAEVTLAPTGKIQCSLVRIDPFLYGAKAEDETEEPVPDEQFNPQVWFKMQGQTVLEDIIADLSSRGHNSLEIHEDGSITVQDEDGGNAFPAFSSFPSRVHWPQVLRALERAGYAADENGDTISVNW